MKILLIIYLASAVLAEITSPGLLNALSGIVHCPVFIGSWFVEPTHSPLVLKPGGIISLPDSKFEAGVLCQVDLCCSKNSCKQEIQELKDTIARLGEELHCCRTFFHNEEYCGPNVWMNPNCNIPNECKNPCFQDPCTNDPCNKDSCNECNNDPCDDDSCKVHCKACEDDDCCNDPPCNNNIPESDCCKVCEDPNCKDPNCRISLAKRKRESLNEQKLNKDSKKRDSKRKDLNGRKKGPLSVDAQPTASVVDGKSTASVNDFVSTTTSTTTSTSATTSETTTTSTESAKTTSTTTVAPSKTPDSKTSSASALIPSSFVFFFSCLIFIVFK